MNSDWQELLERALAGEVLSDTEAADLDAALANPENRCQALVWLQFDAALYEHLLPKEDNTRSQSRERLLAKAILREKHRLVVRREATRHWQIARLAPIAAAAVLLIVGVTFWFWPQEIHSELQASGDFRVLETESEGIADGRPKRGDRLVVGNGSARLTLGGYCQLDLGSDCDVTIRGAPGSEQIELHRGQVDVQITPGRGEFVLLTPLGPVEVKGTEFVTIVDDPIPSEGEHVMRAQTRRVVVTVAVLAGTVVCQLGDGPTVLEQGMNRAFAGEKEDVRGVVAAITDFSLTLKVASGEKTVYHVPRIRKLTIQELSQLRLGDEIGVIWVEEEGKRWIQDIVGKGVLNGVVTGLGDRWIQVTPDGKEPQRFIPPWRGGSPNQGGGLDKEVLKKLGTVRVGDRVQLSWEMPEGKRVVDVKVVERSHREEANRNTHDQEASNLPITEKSRLTSIHRRKADARAQRP